MTARDEAVARVRAQVAAEKALPASEWLANRLHATTTHSDARARLDGFAAEVRAETLREVIDRLANRATLYGDSRTVNRIIRDLDRLEAGEDSECACGPQYRCPNGHCSRHYACQDCERCCSCRCADVTRSAPEPGAVR